MSAPKSSLILVSGAVVLFVLLFISPRHQAESSDAVAREKTGATENNYLNSKRTALTVFMDQATKTLAPALSQQYNQLIHANNADSLMVFWNRLKRPDLAAYCAEELAEKKDSANYWHQAGTRYYYSVQFVKDESEIPMLYERAMFCYDKSLKKDPGLNDAKIMLAACIVENGNDPMKGIALLREVEKADSNNVKLQMTFAQFSVKSGQLEKAITRFKKVLQIDSNAVEIYLHLADTYEKMGRKDLSLQMLEKYQNKTTDPTVKLEVGRYIEQLRNSN